MNNFLLRYLSVNGSYVTSNWKLKSRGGSRVGTVELQHPLLPLDIIDNI
jgi:hypothetical protein